MIDLHLQECNFAKSGLIKLTHKEAEKLSKQIPAWILLEEQSVMKLKRDYNFNDFVGALAFTNQLGKLAEDQNHHPQMLIEWGRVTLTWWSHNLKGLHRNDYIMAAKTDLLFQSY